MVNFKQNSPSMHNPPRTQIHSDGTGFVCPPINMLYFIEEVLNSREVEFAFFYKKY